MSEEQREENLSWYFFIKIVITILIGAAYISYINSGIKYEQFSITTLLYFIPFILDFAIKEVETISRKYQKVVGIILPIVVFILYILMQIIFSDYNVVLENNIHISITIVFSVLGSLFIYFAFSDFNYYTKNRENMLKGRMMVRKQVDEKYRDSYENMYEDIERNKREGIKEIVTKSENNKRRGKP